jgi:hypothetical protein
VVEMLRTHENGKMRHVETFRNEEGG